jgi:hypothetical protein
MDAMVKDAREDAQRFMRELRECRASLAAEKAESYRLSVALTEAANKLWSLVLRA